MTHSQEQASIAAPLPRKMWRLWAARTGWLSIVLLLTVIFIASAPSTDIAERHSWRFTQAVPVARPYMSPITFAAVVVVARFVVLAVFYAVALLIAFRKWDDWFALFVSAALLLVVWGFGARGDTTTYVFPGPLAPLEPALASLLNALFILSWILLIFLLPDGRFVPRRTGWLPFLVLPGTFLSFIADSSFASAIPFRYRNQFAEIAWGLLFIGLLIALLSGLMAQVYRYRRVATPTQRQQMKWILIGLAAQPLPLLFGISGLGGGALEAVGALFIPLFVVTLLPVTIGLAVLRQRLWDVDPLINRSLVYGGLTAFILLFYGLIVGGTSMLFQTRAGVAPALVTALAAFLVVPPFYRQLSQSINRLHPITAPPLAAQATHDERATPFSTVLSGRKLAFARIAWAAVSGLSVLMLTISLRASFAADLFNMMPDLANQLDVTLARVFANNQYLDDDFILFVAFVQLFAFFAVGLLLFWRRSNDWLAILASVMCISVGTGFSTNLMFLPFLRAEWRQLVTIQQMLTFCTLVIFLFVFPNGRFAPRWGRTVAAAWVVYTMTWLFFPQLNPHQASSPVALFILIGFTFGGLTAQVYRYQRVSDPVERQQSKWVIAGFITTNICFFLLVTLSVLGITPQLEEIAPVPVRLMNTLLGLAAIFIPITIALAIFRRRLWDIDLIINRALVYGGLTALVITLYVIVVGIFSAAFRFEDSLALSVLATGLIAILFNPIRLRLQHAVNHLMYGDRDDPVTVIGELGRQLEHSVAPGEALATLVGSISNSLKLPYVAIATREGPGDVIVAAAGAAQPDLLRLPLIYQSQQVGDLLIAPRAPGESFSASERRLLNNIARQAGAAVYAAQLTDHLRRNREQLVLAREEERRRLQRDLHDGLGPQLATLGMQLDVARNLVADSPEAATLLAKLSAETQTAISDIRRLVYGLRPPALDQLGLAGALREYVAGQKGGADGPHVTVEAPTSLPPLPAAVEVAAYRIAQEAVVNCLHHSGASRCVVRLMINGGLTVEVRDNGRGLPPGFLAGIGLTSMRERATELGGECRIESASDGGTQVLAVFPLPETDLP